MGLTCPTLNHSLGLDSVLFWVTGRPTALHNSLGQDQRSVRRHTVNPAFHRTLDAAKIGHLFRAGDLAWVGRGFGDIPAPALGMAVSEGKTTALVVAVGRF